MQHGDQKTHARRVKKNPNVLQAGISAFFDRSPIDIPLQQSDIPKRYTRYGSLLLLGPTFTTHSPEWIKFLKSLDTEARSEFFRSISDQTTGDNTVTHIAVNAPIQMHAHLPQGDGQSDPDVEVENIMRSPTGLQPLYGDFGPASLLLSTTTTVAQQPSRQDFDNAYWTETIQLQNLTQVWAPRWTMFSRGNISEKGRILQDGSNVSPFPGLTEQELEESIGEVDVLDFFVGIGYFAFCYLSRGIRRVWGWDINGWSIEGLRRGCEKNGWGVRVIEIDDDGTFQSSRGPEDLVSEILKAEGTVDAIRCVAFQGNNQWARQTMDHISQIMRARDRKNGVNIRHCNLGLLPTSQGSWNDAFCALHISKGGWLHVHENAEIQGIERQRDEVLRTLSKFACEQPEKSWSVSCDHIEKVKTYAPGVMHCVFDVKMSPSSSSAEV